MFQVTCASNCGSFIWADKSGDLPDIPVDSVIVNPNNPQQVFAGTDFGVYYTDNVTVASPAWNRFDTGIPHVMIWDMQIDRGSTTLSVWTRGRGAFVFPLPSGNISPTPTPTPTATATATATATLLRRRQLPLRATATAPTPTATATSRRLRLLRLRRRLRLPLRLTATAHVYAAYGNGDINSNRYGDRNCNGNRNVDSNAGAECYSNCNGYSNRYGHSHSHSSAACCAQGIKQTPTRLPAA